MLFHLQLGKRGRGWRFSTCAVKANKEGLAGGAKRYDGKVRAALLGEKNAVK